MKGDREDSDEINKEQRGSSAVLAGVAKSTTFALVTAPAIVLKGVLKWFFHSPIKFFRPYAVSPWHILDEMARHEGKQPGLSYLRLLYTSDGLRVASSNFWPLIVLNSISGLILFTTYRASHTFFSSFADPLSMRKESEVKAPWIHFVSGALSGAAVSFLITPVHNIRTLATPRDLVANRHSGILKYSSILVKKLLLSQHNTVDRAKFLFGKLTATSLREAFLYSTFFGTFENLCNLLEKSCDDQVRWTPDGELVLSKTPGRVEQIARKVRKRFIPILLAGASAGVAYNLVAYPLHTYRNVVISSRCPDGIWQDSAKAEVGVKDVWRVVKARGIQPFYAGIGQQLFRVVTPSAVGLFVYRITTDEL